MRKPEQVIISLAKILPQEFTVISCLYTGEEPAYCAPMPRFPAPPTGNLLDEQISEVLKTAHKINPSIHDGAIMFGRENLESPYKITGWSYRLFPPEPPFQVEANRGSAFNSCVAMSLVSGVDALFLISKTGILRCAVGEVHTL